MTSIKDNIQNDIVIEEITCENITENELSEFIEADLISQHFTNDDQQQQQSAAAVHQEQLQQTPSSSNLDNQNTTTTTTTNEEKEDVEVIIQKFVKGELTLSEYSSKLEHKLQETITIDEEEAEEEDDDEDDNDEDYNEDDDDKDDDDDDDNDEDYQVEVKKDSRLSTGNINIKQKPNSNKNKSKQLSFVDQSISTSPPSTTSMLSLTLSSNNNTVMAIRTKGRKNMKAKQLKGIMSKSRKRCILPPALQGLMGEANLCYVRGQYKLAEKACLEIIRQVPLATEPFLTLAQIYESDPEKSMQYSLIAAHLNPNDINQWLRIAQILTEKHNIKLAISCYSYAIRAEPKNIELRLRRIELLESLGEQRTVNRAYDNLLYVIPIEDGKFLLEIAKKVALQYNERGNYVKALDVLRYAYERTSDQFQIEDINFLLELLQLNKKYYQTINVLTAYDENLQIVCKTMETTETISDHSDQICTDTENNLYIESCQIPDNILLEFRTKLIVSLVHLKAFHLLDYLLANVFKFINVEDAGDCYLDIAEALMNEKEFAGALKLLAPLVNSKNYSLAAVWLRYADCLRSTNTVDDAIVAYRKVIELAPQHYEARLILSSLLKQKGCEQEALNALEQDLEKDLIDPHVLYEHCYLLKEIGNLEKFMDVGFLLISRNCYRLRNYDEIHFAISLTRFQERIVSIYKSREAHSEPITDTDLPYFHKCNTDKLPVHKEWQLFLDIVNVAHQCERYSFMQKLTFTVFTSKRFVPYKNEIDFLAMLSTIFNKHPYFAYTLAKDYAVKYLDCPRMWNLFNVVLQFTEDIRYIKFFTRLLKRNLQMDLMPSIIRANYCLSSGTYKYALHYYSLLYRHYPKDPILPLLIAITYCHVSQQKQFAKKHNILQQSIAFMNKYVEMRESKAQNEIYYNMGRFHHQLGMLNIAVHYYNRVLSYQSAFIAEHEHLICLKREAAFNLHLIYKSSGNFPLARKYLYDYIIV